MNYQTLQCKCDGHPCSAGHGCPQGVDSCWGACEFTHSPTPHCCTDVTVVTAALQPAASAQLWVSSPLSQVPRAPHTLSAQGLTQGTLWSGRDPPPPPTSERSTGPGPEHLSLGETSRGWIPTHSGGLVEADVKESGGQGGEREPGKEQGRGGEGKGSTVQSAWRKRGTEKVGALGILPDRAH